MSARSWLIGGLVVSGVLNVFLVGAGAGALIVRHRVLQAVGAPAAARVRPTIPAAARALPQAERPAYRMMLRARAQASRPDVIAARVARREGFEALGAEPFDAEAAKARLAEARRLDSNTRGALEDALVTFAGGLPAPERKALSTALAGVVPPPPPAQPAQRPQAAS